MIAMRTSLLLVILAATANAQDGPPRPTSGDFTIRDFRFASGEVLPELRLHYRTFGTAERGADGHVKNAVLILHGTTGHGGNFVRPEFSGELFGPGAPWTRRSSS